MEKNIKLIMDTKKEIKILVNNEEKHIIFENNRNISADKIYEIINFSLGDHYTVIKENKSKIDEQVLNFFYELFNDIINKINSLDEMTENTISSDSTEPNFPVEQEDDIPF